MKNSRLAIICLLILLLSGCKSQQQNLKGIELPAYQSNNDVELLRNIMNAPDYENSQKLIVNDFEYPLKDLQKILDTISKDYKLIIKNDSISNKKLLIIKTSN